MQDKATLLFLTLVVYAGLAVCVFSSAPFGPSPAAIAIQAAANEHPTDLSPSVAAPTGGKVHRRPHGPPAHWRRVDSAAHAFL